MGLRLNNCCCCCGIRTGALVLNILGLIFCSISFVYTFVSLFDVDYIIDAYQELSAEAKQDEMDGKITSDECDLIIKYDNIFINGLRGIVGVSFAFVFIRLLFEISLLFGIVKNRHGFMLPWLIYYSVTWIFGGLTTLGLGVWVMCDLYVGAGIGIIVIGGIILGLEFYFGLVIYSEYQNIRDGFPGGGNLGGIVLDHTNNMIY